MDNKELSFNTRFDWVTVETADARGKARFLPVLDTNRRLSAFENVRF